MTNTTPSRLAEIKERLEKASLEFKDASRDVIVVNYFSPDLILGIKAADDIAYLLALVEKYEKALEFYADNKGLRINFQTNKFESLDSDGKDFHGAIARQALEDEA